MVEIIATVVGGYPRPPELRKAINKALKGEISKEELDRIAREATAKVIKEQVEAGLDLVTDGQLMWDDMLRPFALKFKGIEVNGLIRFFDNNFYYRIPVVKDRVEWVEPVTVEDYKYAKTVSPKPVKAVLPGPFTFAKLAKDQFYGSLEKLALDLAEALRKEAQALVEAGAEIIQFDEPSLVDPEVPREEVEIGIEAVNAALEGLSATTMVYTYFSSASRAFDLLLDLKADGIGFDLVAGWDVVEMLHEYSFPAIGLGLSDARNIMVEDPEELASRIRVAAEKAPELKTIYVNHDFRLDLLPYANVKPKLEVISKAVRVARERLS